MRHVVALILCILSANLVRGDEPPEQVFTDPIAWVVQVADIAYLNHDYDEARYVCSLLLSLKSLPPETLDRLRLIEAECCRLQARYVEAATKYRVMLEQKPPHRCRELIAERAFDIANYWLNDTREEMREFWKSGTSPTGWEFARRLFGFVDGTPVFCPEAMALNLLDVVSGSDGHTGPRADKANFYAATVHFYRGRYDRAGERYERVVRAMADGELAPKCTKQAYICRRIGMKDPNDWGNIVAARILLELYRTRHRDAAADDAAWVNRQLREWNEKGPIVVGSGMPGS